MQKSMAAICNAAISVCLGTMILGGRVQAADFGSDVGQGTFGVGLNYPGLGMRYFPSDQLALEVKGEVDKDVVVGGLRGYCYLTRVSRGALFLGAEADYIHFKGAVSRGSGAVGQVFGGFEYFILQAVALQADFGPAYIYLKNQQGGLSVSGVEYTANFGFNFYWGGRMAQESRPYTRDEASWLRY